MEHINTLFGNRLSALKGVKLPNFKRSLSKVDSVFTISMIIFGIIGCLSVLYLQASPNRHLDNSLILTGSAPGYTPPSYSNTSIAIASEIDIKPNFVEIQGDRKAGNELSFIIDAFVTDADYSFDFGNGKTLKVIDRKTSFSYPSSGLYEVYLDVTFQGETKRLPIESLWITK